jgi:hypothetical protein
MENNIAVGSQFTVGPRSFATVSSANVFTAGSTGAFIDKVSVNSFFYISSTAAGDANSSYPVVHYLFVGRTGR